MDKILFISDFPEVQYGKNAGTPALRLIVEALQKKYELVTVKPDSLPGNPLAMKWHNYQWTFKAFNQAKNLMKDNEFKLVYAAGCNSVVAAGELTRCYGIRSVGRLFGTYLYPHLGNRIQLAIKSDECAAFRAPCTKFIITDDGTGGDIVAEHFGMPPEKLCFWRNGVETPPAVVRHPSSLIRVISMARLEKWKHVERIIHAFEEVALMQPNLILDVVGGGPEEKRLKGLVTNPSVVNRINFYGEIDRRSALGHLARADIFISTNDYSNVSNSLMEAMAAGKPVIALNAGMTGRTISGRWNGWLAFDYDLTEALATLAKEPELRKTLGDAAREYARENFETWETRIAREVAVCEGLMQ